MYSPGHCSLIDAYGGARAASRRATTHCVHIRCGMSSLAGEVAIVTGGGDGIGGATARLLAEEGASVLIVEKTELGEQNAAAIRGMGGVAQAIALDVSKSADVKAMVAAAVEKFGKLTILVNNA
jgi:NAD(P)-dependent dehydrogenase (short-subunit alcohol dehydrogenase family)